VCVNNLLKVATQWNSGATRDSNRGHRVLIPSALTTRPPKLVDTRKESVPHGHQDQPVLSQINNNTQTGRETDRQTERERTRVNALYPGNADVVARLGLSGHLTAAVDSDTARNVTDRHLITLDTQEHTDR